MNATVFIILQVFFYKTEFGRPFLKSRIKSRLESYPLKKAQYVPPSTPHEEEIAPKFTFQHVSSGRVKKNIKSMPSNKSPGYDKIHLTVIKTCLPHILPVIIKIFNASLMTGCFPKDWKLGQEVAHPKDGDHELASITGPFTCYPSCLRYWSALLTNSLFVFRHRTSLAFTKAGTSSCIP